MTETNIFQVLKNILTKRNYFIIFSIFIFLNIFFMFYSVFRFTNINNTNLLLYSIGKLSGLIGFLFLSMLIFSGDTARYFDRFFGINNIILFQRKFSLVTFSFVLLHPIFFIISSKSALPYIIPNFSLIPLAVGIISLYFLIIIMISSYLYKRISYRIWQYIHILTYLLFFFSLYHAIKIGSDYSYFPIKVVYFILAILIIIGIVYRTHYKIKQLSDKFYVREIRKETEDAFTLILETNNKFTFKPGQFCFLRINKKGIYARHPFTISSLPEEKYLSFTIKLKGRFTKEAFNLKSGEEIFIDGPFGIFTLDKADKNKELVFIAGGVGITPFFSIIKSNLNSDIKRDITLFYCTKTLENMIFRRELDNIKENWFKKIYVLSRDECSGYEKGRINKEIIIKNLGDVSNCTFFICGPEEMNKCVVKELAELGVKKQDIIIESFFGEMRLIRTNYS